MEEEGIADRVKIPIVETLTAGMYHQDSGNNGDQDPGILLKIGEMIRIARLTIPTIKAAVFMVEIFSINALNFSVVSIGFTPSG